METLFNDINNGAKFSECGTHRYSIWRIWDKSKQIVMFIGLNPSTANQDSDDPTIRRVIKFASNWGYGGVYMMNLFTQVTPYPHELKLNDDEQIIENRDRIFPMAEWCKLIIFAWGNFKEAEQEGQHYSDILNGYCLGKNQNGSPKHPLYIHSKTQPTKFK